MSELRQDLVSGDWIIVAPARGGRPHNIKEKKSQRKSSPQKSCPFEDLKRSGNWPPILSYPNKENWRVILIPNKYPALSHDKNCASSFFRKPYLLKTGAGFHDLIVTRDHKKNFADLSITEATRVFQILQERYKMLAKDGCSIYTSTFFNWGASAGASIYHPHYQILTLPIVPPDVEHSLRGSERYFKSHHRCVHCVMLKFDLKEKTRVIENSSRAVAVAPFVSREPFEVRIFPKKHLPYFEKTSLADLKSVAITLQSALKRIRKYLNDPDFNFFIHTAPLKSRGYDYYHWHIEIVPKISIIGGFELGTGVEINVVDPERATQILKGKTSY